MERAAAVLHICTSGVLKCIGSEGSFDGESNLEVAYVVGCNVLHANEWKQASNLETSKDGRVQLGMPVGGCDQRITGEQRHDYWILYSCMYSKFACGKFRHSKTL